MFLRCIWGSFADLEDVYGQFIGDGLGVARGYIWAELGADLGQWHGGIGIFR